jgi:hypothetical protein
MLTLAHLALSCEVMSKTTRAEKAAALERWAERVEPDEIVAVDTSVLRQLAKLADHRRVVDSEITRAVDAARRANRSWAEIGVMLGVSKQAAQRKYGRQVGST